MPAATRSCCAAARPVFGWVVSALLWWLYFGTHIHVCVCEAVQQSCADALYPAHLSANRACFSRRPLLLSLLLLKCHFWALLCVSLTCRAPAHPLLRAHALSSQAVQQVSGDCTCKQALRCVDGSTRCWGRYCATLQVCGSHCEGCFGLGNRLLAAAWGCHAFPLLGTQPCRTQPCCLESVQTAAMASSAGLCGCVGASVVWCCL